MQPASILKIESLPEDWCDKDVVILHACFQLLKDFVEQEKELIEVIDWQHDEETKNIKAEIDFLYKWWLERVDKENDLDEKQYEKDNHMLKRLVEVRIHLWT